MKRTITYAISTRHDGNMGLHVGDDPLNVIKNRQLFLEKNALTLDTLITANQVHSDTIRIVTAQECAKGARDHSTAIPSCDALITNEPHVTLGIVTADCVPVLLYDPVAGVIAAIHAGWKGTASNITQKTLQKMVDTWGCNPQNIHAFIAPAIGVCCYEVGDDTALQCGCAGASHLDLKKINYDQLLSMNVSQDNITLSPLCTSCHNDDYFSYRADQGQTGRIMAVISL